MRIARGSTIQLSSLAEDLEVEGNSRILCTGDSSSLRVSGDIRCKGSIEFVGNVFCNAFSGKDCRVRVVSIESDTLVIEDGSVEVSGNLKTRCVDVDKQLLVRGSTEAEDIDVGGILELNSVSAHSVSVGGKFRALGDVNVESIEVGGSVEVQGKIKSSCLDVGGKAMLNGGEIIDSIDIGGILTSNAPLNFGNIDVGGIVTLTGPSMGGNVDVGGKFKVEGDVAFKTLEIGGLAEITGKADGSDIEIGGKLSVGASLNLDQDLEVGGKAEIQGTIKARHVEVGGALSSESMNIESADFSGQVSTRRGVFAKGKVVVLRKSRVIGWIRSLDRVLVESRAEVDSVYAPFVTLEERVRAQNVYADNLEIDYNAEILGEVLYTSMLAAKENVRFARPPIKVDSIPEEKKRVGEQ